MRKAIVISAAALAALVPAGAPSAHHSLAAFETSAPQWVQGRVVRFARVSPHSRIYLDETLDDGEVRRWAIDGPDGRTLERMGIGPDFLRIGEVIEVCGFPTKSGAESQAPFPVPGGRSGQLFNGHLIVLPDGQKQFWSDYGQLRQCVSEEERKVLLESRWRPEPNPGNLGREAAD